MSLIINIEKDWAENVIKKADISLIHGCEGHSFILC